MPIGPPQHAPPLTHLPNSWLPTGAPTKYLPPVPSTSTSTSAIHQCQRTQQFLAFH
ncbi:hypothetical protein LZ30DRAFT_725783 [Colletotrichum cereale]|nr:hypothetical protein LZ30DRAFT_725783 [Colletotrichum cereale]